MRASWQDPPEYRGGGGGGLGGSQFAMPRLTPGVRLILFANGGVFLISFLLYLLPFSEGVALGFQRWFGISPGMWVAGFPFVPLWQVFSWGFLHSLNQPTHILFNMLFLYFLGTMLEEVVGTRRLLVTYVCALLVSGIVTLMVGLVAGPNEALVALGLPVSQQYMTTVGASGAVLAVVVAMAVLRPDTRVIFIIFPITLKTLAIVYVGLDVFNLLLELKGAATSNVARTAHLSGAAFGYLVVRRGWIWRDPVAKIEAIREASQEKQAADDEERLDELLSKINQQGIHSLSAREKAFLKRVSKRR